MARIVCLMREPFADKVPSLVSLLTYMGQAGHSADLVLPDDSRYLPPSCSGQETQVLRPANAIQIAGVRIRLPLTLSLAISGLRLCRSRPRPQAVLGIGSLGLLASYLVSRLARLPLLCFSVELPQPPAVPRGRRVVDAIERFCYRRAALVIIQDDCRRQFLVNEIHVQAERVAVLPNGTLTTRSAISKSLASDQVQPSPAAARVVMHCGGLGPWFESFELAKAALLWPDPWRLTFHTSHWVEDDPYFQAVKSACDGSKILLATRPVKLTELDGIVRTASIGLAWYSLEKLGYRGELMGMAAGKIGQYLKCGLPVVCKDIGTIRSFLEQYNCGLCVGTLSELPDAFAQIWSNYDLYSQNALRCYRELWDIEGHCAAVLGKVEEVIGPASFGAPRERFQCSAEQR